MNRLWIFSGYFINGLTAGHKATLSWIRERMAKYDKVMIIINNPLQQALKYKTARRKVHEIVSLVEPFLDNTFGDKYYITVSKDRDRTVRETLKYIRHWYLAKKFIFCNSGDVKSSCPEEEVKGITFLYIDLPKISNSGEEKND